MVIMFMMLIMFTKVSFVLIVILRYRQYFAVLSINQSFVFDAVFQDFYFVTAAQMLFVFVIDIFKRRRPLLLPLLRLLAGRKPLQTYLL